MLLLFNLFSLSTIIKAVNNIDFTWIDFISTLLELLFLMFFIVVIIIYIKNLNKLKKKHLSLSGETTKEDGIELTSDWNPLRYYERLNKWALIFFIVLLLILVLLFILRFEFLPTINASVILEIMIHITSILILIVMIYHCIVVIRSK